MTDEKRGRLALSALRYFVRSNEWRALADACIHEGHRVRGVMYAVASGLAYAACVIASESYNRESAPNTGTPPAPPLPQPKLDKRRLN